MTFNEKVFSCLKPATGSVTSGATVALFRLGLLFAVGLLGTTVSVARDYASGNYNEELKSEIYCYIEYKPQSAGSLSKVTLMFDSTQLISQSGTTSSAGEWLKTSLFKIGGDDAVVNAPYRLPDVTCLNVEQYRIHVVPAPGFDVFSRPRGTNVPYKNQSVFEFTPGSAVSMEVGVLPSSQQGALAGKSTTQDISDGRLRLALGFLPNGKSAGYIDFAPEVISNKAPNPNNSYKLKVEYGRPPGGADLSTLNTTDQVEVIQIPVPQYVGTYAHMTQPATVAMRQVVSPQTVADVSRDGFKTIIKFYTPSQRGARITSESNPYGGPAVNYTAETGPYALSGEPFVTYEIDWTSQLTELPSTSYRWNFKLESTFSVLRREGSKEYTATNYKPETIMIVRPGIGQTLVECSTCYGSGTQEGACYSCGGSGEEPGTCQTCLSCLGLGTQEVPCGACGGDGLVTEYYATGGYIEAAYDNVVQNQGFGLKSETIHWNYPFPTQPPPPNPPEDYEIIYDAAHTRINTTTPASTSARMYLGGFPWEEYYIQENKKGWFGLNQGGGYSQKLKLVMDGDQGLATKFSHYISNLDPAVGAGQQGRLKWRLGSDGGWTMYEYAQDFSSLGQTTKTITPYGDTGLPDLPATGGATATWYAPTGIWMFGFPAYQADFDYLMPATIPAITSAAGYRITTTTYANDWEGVKRLPDTITTTADGQQVGYTDYDYSTSVANGQPLWVIEAKTYTSNGNYLTSIGKIYEGSNVAPWLHGLPYSSQAPDGAKESIAYHRGTYNSGPKTFTKSDTGLGFRSIVFKGRASAAGGGTPLSSYDGVSIDTIYMIPNVSIAEVTLRDDRAFTARTETLLYTGVGAGWILIDSADMQYDSAGNLTRREKFNGTLYEATYVNGQKDAETDEQGLTTNFYYDAEGRVSHTIRAAFGSVPALRTSFTYDDENRVLSTAVGEPGGEQITSSKTYNKAGSVLTETTEGLTTSYEYTVENNILVSTKVTLPGGATRILTNYRDGRPKSVTGTAGVAEYYTYAVEGGLETVTKRFGSETSPRWTKTYTDWANRTIRMDTSSVDANGAAATLIASSSYNALGQLASSQTDTLATAIYSYDGNGVMNSFTQADRKNSFVYDYRTDPNVWASYSGDATTLWDYSETRAYPANATDSQVQTKTWTRVTNFSSISPPVGVTGTAIAESIAADANGNRTATQTFLDRAAAKVTTVVWSPFASQPAIAVSVAGRFISQTTSAGVTNSYGYDSLGRAASSTDRTGTSNVAYHPGTARLYTVTDARGVTQHTYGYDVAGRLVQDQTPRVINGSTSGTNSSYFAYNTRGQLTHVWGDVPYPVKYDYNDYGDRTDQYTYRDSGTNWSSPTLASSGWPGSGDNTHFDYYDANGLVWKKSDPVNKTVTYTYNVRGQLKTRTWARGTVTTYNYNDTAIGDLSSASYSDGTPSLSYTYDRLGRLQTVHDAAGDRTFTYRTTDLKAAAELFGRVNATVTSHFLGTGRQLTNQYHATTGRFIGYSLDNGGSEHAVGFGFDPANGRLASVASGAGTFTYGYLANSNLISGVTRGSYSQSRTYEPNRNALSTLATTSQAGTIAGYSYASDDLGRRKTVDQSGLVYDPYTLGVQLMRTAYGYDYRNEVTSAATTVGGTTLPGRSFGYAFDPIGNRTQDSLDSNVSTYTPNSLNQYSSRGTPTYLPVTGTANHTGGASLTVNGASVSTWVNNYFHQAVSKANTGSASYQVVNLSGTASGMTQPETVGSLVRPVSEAFTYDFDGNLTSDSLWVYRYDGENRLYEMTAKVALGAAAPQALRFRYDYMGRRVAKELYTYTGAPEAPTGYTLQSKTYFAWNGWTLIAEYDTNLALTRKYTFGVDLSGSLGGAGNIGGLLAIQDVRPATAGTYLSAFDGNGNLMALVDGANGSLAAAYEYDPFGNVLRATGDYGKENPFRFAGKYFDTESGLSFFGFRYYSASIGRFVNRDPLEEHGGWTLYSALKFGAANPFAGASGVDGTSWATEWEQTQSRLLSNTSLAHTTQAVRFESKKNSGLPGSSSTGQKTYTANATGHYAQGGASGKGPQAPRMSAANPGAGNADINLYCYAANNPINGFDAMGLDVYEDGYFGAGTYWKGVANGLRSPNNTGVGGFFKEMAANGLSMVGSMLTPKDHHENYNNSVDRIAAAASGSEGKSVMRQVITVTAATISEVAGTTDAIEASYGFDVQGNTLTGEERALKGVSAGVKLAGTASATASFANRSAAILKGGNGLTKMTPEQLRAAGFQDHHIISDKNPLTKNHALLKEADFDLQSRGNKIWLPEDGASHATRSIHLGRHLNSVSKNLAKQMDEVLAYGKANGWTKEQYRAALEALIRQERALLRSGQRALNRNARPGAN